MKNKISKFFHKYRICLLFSFLLFAGLFLSNAFADLYKTCGDMFTFDLWDLYIILGIPFCSSFFGGLMYARIKKIWVPQLVCFVANLFLYLIYCSIIREIEPSAILMGLLFAGFEGVFLLFGAWGMSTIYNILKTIKEKNDNNTIPFNNIMFFTVYIAIFLLFFSNMQAILKLALPNFIISVLLLAIAYWDVFRRKEKNNFQRSTF